MFYKNSIKIQTTQYFKACFFRVQEHAEDQIKNVLYYARELYINIIFKSI